MRTWGGGVLCISYSRPQNQRTRGTAKKLTREPVMVALAVHPAGCCPQSTSTASKITVANTTAIAAATASRRSLWRPHRLSHKASNADTRSVGTCA